MTVSYIRVNAVADLFAPAVRGTGNVAIIGTVTPPTTPPPDLLQANVPAVISTVDEAQRRASGALGDAIALALAQTPGPPLVYGVRTATNNNVPDWAAALAVVAGLDAQIVVLAGTALNATTGNAGSTPPGAIAQLAAHVTSVSNTGGDGMERIGVAMLAKNSADPTIVAGALANERMVYIAHKSDQDAAAAVAGTIAGYAPHISILLKPVSINTGMFTPADIQTLNGTETFNSGPAGLGVNWFADPVLIPGSGVYMGEGYTGNPGGMKYIDIVRAVDNVKFLLKAQLIKSIGGVRISRAGLRALRIQMESVLDPLIPQEIIEGYDISIPILNLLDRDPNSLTASELTQINNAQNQRVVEILVAVDYAGAIHRLAITLKFT
jgi:hypothetical protein